MSYASATKTLDKRLTTVVKIDAESCNLTHATEPCIASGANKCFNTFGTCQDKPALKEKGNYGTVLLEFSALATASTLYLKDVDESLIAGDIFTLPSSSKQHRVITVDAYDSSANTATVTLNSAIDTFEAANGALTFVSTASTNQYVFCG